VDDPYCWPGTDCLHNRLGLHDPEELTRAEHELVGIRTAALTASVVPGAYDTAHLLRFHRLLFQDVYDWAGQLRVGDISKGDQSFCPVQLLGERLEQLFARLAERRFLVELEGDSFVLAFASLYGELNALHPFREGNGRAQRAFLRQLAAHAGWTVGWERLDLTANVDACREYLATSKPDALVRLLVPVVVPLVSWRHLPAVVARHAPAEAGTAGWTAAGAVAPASPPAGACPGGPGGPGGPGSHQG
jgi:cell filamentation protein